MIKKCFYGILKKRSIVFSAVIAMTIIGFTSMPGAVSKYQLTDISMSDEVKKEKERCEKTAKGVEGVIGVESEIEVVYHQ
jgi:hypothetical protein